MNEVELKEFFEDIRTPIPRQIDVNLRIKLLKKQLSYRTDLTVNERRALQARKNTSILRLRKITEKTIAELHNELIPKVAFLVS